ncbi:hypothetical protein DMI72_01330 [Akkermansia muciniphila]|nr:hypothetical protein DMI72_01330 [Akkermansia muciniphila]
MNIPATLKHSFLLCLFAAAVPLRAIPAPMQVTASTPARVWTEGYGTGNGRLGILSFGVFPKETVVLNEGSIFAKKNFQMREGAAEALDKARELCKEGKYRSADQLFRKNILPPATLRGIISRGASSGGIPRASFTFLLSAYAGYAAGQGNHPRPIRHGRIDHRNPGGPVQRLRRLPHCLHDAVRMPRFPESGTPGSVRPNCCAAEWLGAGRTGKQRRHPV